MIKYAIILGSAHHDGEAADLARQLADLSGYDLFDLCDYTIGPYDYEHENRNDDFLPLMRKLLSDYEGLLFVTPVYWYAMSGTLKTFFDRLTDLLTIEKELGRQLTGKYMAAVSISYGNHLEELFWLPFQYTADYLEMHYKGGMHTITGQLDPNALKSFIRTIQHPS